jgi:hypothetical protein
MRTPNELPQPTTLPRERPSRVLKWLGWLELVAAPSFFALVTWYHVHDESSMAGIIWLLSIPTAFFVYLLPGTLLLVAPRSGLVPQVLPAFFTGYLVFLMLVTFLQ